MARKTTTTTNPHGTDLAAQVAHLQRQVEAQHRRLLRLEAANPRYIGAAEAELMLADAGLSHKPRDVTVERHPDGRTVQ